jgi:hypothetical protein
MKDKNDVWQGTLALMVLKTLDAMDRNTVMGSPGGSSRLAPTGLR